MSESNVGGEVEDMSCQECHGTGMRPGLDDEPDDGDAPRGEPAAGWTRVGRYDSPRRRALWVRFHQADEWHMGTVEMCAGREGDDQYVRLEAGSPGFDELVGCLLHATDHLGARGMHCPDMPTPTDGGET